MAAVSAPSRPLRTSHPSGTASLSAMPELLLSSAVPEQGFGLSNCSWIRGLFVFEIALESRKNNLYHPKTCAPLGIVEDMSPLCVGVSPASHGLRSCHVCRTSISLLSRRMPLHLAARICQLKAKTPRALNHYSTTFCRPFATTLPSTTYAVCHSSLLSCRALSVRDNRMERRRITEQMRLLGPSLAALGTLRIGGNGEDAEGGAEALPAALQPIFPACCVAL